MCEPLGTNGFPTHIKTVSQQWLGKDFPQFIAPLPSFTTVPGQPGLVDGSLSPTGWTLNQSTAWGYKCSLRLSTSQKHSHSHTHLPEKRTNTHTKKETSWSGRKGFLSANFWFGRRGTEVREVHRAHPAHFCTVLINFSRSSSLCY